MSMLGINYIESHTVPNFPFPNSRTFKKSFRHKPSLNSNSYTSGTAKLKGLMDRLFSTPA